MSTRHIGNGLLLVSDAASKFVVDIENVARITHLDRHDGITTFVFKTKQKYGESKDMVTCFDEACMAWGAAKNAQR